MALNSIGNLFFPSQSFRPNSLNTVSGMARNIWEESGWNSPTPPAGTGTSAGSVQFNRSIFENLGGIRTAASALQRETANMASLSRFSPGIGRTAETSQSGILTATVANNATVSNVTRTDVNVTQLASAQQNQGAALNASENSFGDRFSISITNASGTSQTFNVAIAEGNTNQDAMQAMANQINASSIGVRATLVEDEESGTVRLQLDGQRTGEREGRFTVEDNSAAALSNVARESASAQFTVNNVQRSSESNQNVTLFQGVTADLQQTGQTQITYGRDMNSAVSSVQRFLDAFNNLRGAAANSPALSRQLNTLASTHSRALSFSEIGTNSEGRLTITDADRLQESIQSGSFARNFQGHGSLGNRIHDTARNAFSVAYSSAVQSNFANIVNASNQANPTSQADWASALRNVHSNTGLIFSALA
jgi:flagellar capping protein FliD